MTNKSFQISQKIKWVGGYGKMNKNEMVGLVGLEPTTNGL